MKWNPFNGRKKDKGGRVPFKEKPDTFEEAQHEYNQLSLQLGHHTRQRDVVIPAEIKGIHKRMDFLEGEAKRLQAEKEARERQAAAKAPAGELAKA